MDPIAQGLEQMRQEVDLIPERLRVDHQAITAHASRLTLKREVVDVLVHRDLDREINRVP
ncbi:MAG: hypothetical protein R3A48_19135 [Polyangiales bacterium]